MIILNGLLVVFTGLYWFLLGCVPSPCLVSLFLGGASVTLFDVYLISLLVEFASLEGVFDLWPILSASSGSLSLQGLVELFSSGQ